MRVWDVPLRVLCNKHLVAMHVEIHSIFNVITEDKKGYANHPETMRWRPKVLQLAFKHDEVANEMHRRGLNHHSVLQLRPMLAGEYNNVWPKPITPLEEQWKLLGSKNCECPMP